MSIQALREERAAKAKQLKELVDKKEWNAAVDQPIYDAAMADIDVIDKRINNMQRAAETLAEQQLNEQVAERSGQRGKDEKSPALQVFSRFLRGGLEGLTPEERAAYNNTMSTTTGSQGGYTVPTEIAAYVTDLLKAYGNMRQVATVIQTSAGNEIDWPTSDGRNEVGEIIGQNTTATGSDPSFGSVALKVYKFSSKIVAVPFELLQDSVVDIEAFVARRLAQRLGRITQQKFTVGAGDGSSEPNGVITASSVGVTGAAAQLTTFLYDDLVSLEHSVDYAYRELGNCAYMCHDTAVKAIKRIKDTAGRPLFMPGWLEGYNGKFKDTIMGYPLVTNNSMAVPAASAKSLAFGDFSNYIIRDVMEVSLFRFTDSAYTKLGQVGFLGWLRSGGNLVDTAAISLFQHAAS